MSGGWTPEKTKRCAQYQNLTWLLTPLATQVYQPTMPLLITLGLGLPMWQLGCVYFTKMLCSAIGFGAMVPLLSKFSPRTCCLLMLTLRAISGVLHGIACLAITPATLPLLYIRSAIHGFSIGMMALGPTWIGVRMPKEERGTAQSVLMGMNTLGISLGPMIGSLMARQLPTDLQDYGAGGWWVLLVSVVHILATLKFFDDDEVMPKQEAKAVGTVTPTHLTVVRLSCFVQFFAFMATLGAESIVAVLMYDMYGWDAGQSLPMFMLLGTTSFVSIAIFLATQSRLSLAQMALIWNAGAILGAALAVHWANFEEYNPPLQVGLAYFVWFSLSGVSFGAHNALASVRLPEDSQSKYMPIIQTFGQLGRAFGPIVFTNFYDAADAALPGSAPNLSLLLQALLCIVGYGVPWFWFRQMYGGFGDGPFTKPAGAGGKELV